MAESGSAPLLNRSVIGRLLDELSWVGKSIRDYREGGVGFENVLVAETLLALDFLPRTRFLGGVVEAATGADGTRSKVIADIEDAHLVVLPPEIKLPPSGGSYPDPLVIQPDASLIAPSTCTLIEAKRLRQGSFQREQLAREYVAVIRSAGDRAPLLLLIIPYAPPVPVKGLGRMTVHEAIATSLERVLERTEARKGDLAELTERIPQTIAWVTWKQLGNAVRNARAAFVSEDVSVVRTIDRLCDLVTDSIQRHG